ncbi:MAG TPA: M64 family metallopeptidase [Pyrinomonadaceae bacterium]|jgi:hypothetical protein
MGTSDGRVIGSAKILDNGPDSRRWTVVVLPDGYREAELPQFAADAQQLVNTLSVTPPFSTGRAMSAINVHRIDVASTDSGADDPVACHGTGAVAATYFDAHFCEAGIRRLLVVDDGTAIMVAGDLVPEFDMIFVLVNSTVYGGSGGAVAVFSKAPGAMRIAIHEMGHTAFGLADEYPYWRGCGTGEAGRDTYTGAEPVEPNVTAVSDRAAIKWRSLIAAATPVPTTQNADCGDCDPQPSPVAAGTVGAFEGARNFHCGLFRPSFNCCMRDIDAPFCAVCARHITTKLAPFLPQ